MRYEICISDTLQPFIGDMLLFLSSGRLIKQISEEPIIIPTKLSEPNLAQLLQKSAVELFTSFRQGEAQDFASVAAAVTTDFEALYAYKRGDYQQCLQLSTQNVNTILYTVVVFNISNEHTQLLQGRFLNISTFPKFIQLLDDDIVSLTALTVIVANHKCRHQRSGFGCVTQLTLSLYLMTQCQLKLRHSATSLAHRLYLIKAVRSIHPAARILDHLTLKLSN